MYINLIKLVKKSIECRTISLNELNGIYDCIEDRILWLECKEPDSCGVVYDEWQDKYDDLNNIFQMCDDINNNVKSAEDIIDNIDDIIDMLFEIKYYQQIYGGLSRLRVYM